MSESVFGPGAATTRLYAGVEHRADDGAVLGEWPEDLRGEVSEPTAWLLSNFQFYVAAAIPDMHLSDDGAQMMVINHATNDVLTLLAEVVHMDGRPAARTARALFEHLVNYVDLQNSHELRERYIQHRLVTEDLIGQRQLYYRVQGRRRIPGPTTAQKKLLRKSHEPLRRALARFGTAFRRGFTSQSLRSRAQAHGLDEGYDGYRILSGVMHGSSGGLLGTRKTIKGSAVHRTGPDLELATIAYIEGLTWWTELLRRTTSESGSTSRIDLLIEASEALIGAWPEVSDAIAEVDRRLWPSSPPIQVMAILAMFPRGERWYLYRPHEATVTPAEPIEGQDVREVVDRARELYRGYVPASFGGRPMTVAVTHIRVKELEGARSANASSILVPEDIKSLYAIEDFLPPRRLPRTR